MTQNDLLGQTLAAMPAWRERKPRSHAPHFRVVAMPAPAHAAGTDWMWLYDGPQKIGLVQTWTKEIEMFRFEPMSESGVKDYALPTIHHFATLIGAKINIHAPGNRVAHEPLEYEWVQGEGSALELKTLDRLKNGIVSESSYRLEWDDLLGYVWRCRTHVCMPEPIEVEFNNMLAGGVSESRDDRKRWQKVLQGVGPGRAVWFYHNPLNVLPREIASNGYVGFAREADMNPFLALESVNTGMKLATCDQWYDQHIIALPPAAPEDDGRYHVRARYRFHSLPADVVAEIEADAECVNVGPTDVLGFLPGVVNDFEQGVSGERMYNGFTWKPGFADRACGYSGNVSLKLAGKGVGRPAVITRTTAGAGIYTESAKRYRLSGWVKTALDAGEAFIEVQDCIWTWRDVRATRRSAGVAGHGDWTETAIEFQPGPDNPFIVINLCVDGVGDAWFDDLALTEA